ncbi:MAG: CHAT domain-containing tetratricopeptide repeat protein [Chryseolinea sp.]
MIRYLIISSMVLFSYNGNTQSLMHVDSLISDAQFEKATEWVDAQLKGNIPDEKKIILIGKKADALTRLGRFADSEELLSTIQPEAKTPFQKSVIQSAYGSLYLNEGLYDQAFENFSAALQNLAKDKSENSLDAAQVLSYIGNLYRATGKYTQAEEMLGRSLSIRQKLLKENSEWVAASYNDLGLVYSQTDNDRALEYYEKALKIYEKLHGKDHPKIAIANTNIGFIYTNLELYGDAINNFESALRTWEKIYTKAHPTKAFLFFNLGETYLKIHNPKTASEYYQKALTMYQESYGSKHPDIAVVFNALGNLNLAEHRYDDALNDYQSSLITNVRNFDAADVRKNPSLSEYYNGRTLINSLLYKAQALEARYYGETIRMSDLTLALKTIQACDSLIDRLRQHISSESDKIILGVIANDVYASGVRISYETGEVAANKKKWYALSFYFAEKSKSAVLLEAISDVNAKSFARIPESLLQEERKAKAGIALLTQQLAQKPSPIEERTLREYLFSMNRKYEQFTARLEKEYPEYYNLKYSNTSPSIFKLQNKLDRKTAIVSYFIDDKNNHLYEFTITKTKFKVRNTPLSKDLEKVITGLRNSLYFNAIETYRIAASTLSKVLIPKSIPHSVKALVIIPTGRLSIIPFETLLTRKIKSGDDLTTFPYLLKKYNVRYEFAASMILQRSTPPASTDKSIFLCAPVTFMPTQQLPDLPGTESEVNGIAQLFAVKNLKSDAFLRGRADEKIAKSGVLKEYGFLHFATHGVVDEKRPELSRIFLQSGSSDEDGSLFSGEIYNLELNADLVTLSACQTGLGKISKGEGVIGLSRALLYAGARNILVSFWSVADESTAILMKEFYKNVLQGNVDDYGENLRVAKLSLMSQEKYRSPYYWAPFVLIGF